MAGRNENEQHEKLQHWNKNKHWQKKKKSVVKQTLQYRHVESNGEEKTLQGVIETAVLVSIKNNDWKSKLRAEKLLCLCFSSSWHSISAYIRKRRKKKTT